MMSERRFVDTNVVIRHLVRDDPRLAAVARSLFERSDRGEVELIVLPAVLAECVFVLESFYKLPRPDIVRSLKALMTSPGVSLPNLPTHLDALDRYSTTRFHFVDCLLAASSATERISIATFDKQIERFGDVSIDLG